MLKNYMIFSLYWRASIAIWTLQWTTLGTKANFLDMWVIKNIGILPCTAKKLIETFCYWRTVLIPPHWREVFPKVSFFFRLKRVCNTTEDFVQKSWRHESEICPASVSHWLDWRGLWDCTKIKKTLLWIVEEKKNKREKLLCDLYHLLFSTLPCNCFF